MEFEHCKVFKYFIAFFFVAPRAYFATYVGLARTENIGIIYTVYDRISSDIPANNTVYTPYIYMVLANLQT